MSEKEKRKPLPTWYRPVGLAIMFIGLGLCCLAPLLLGRGISPRAFLLLTFVLAISAGIGGALYMWTTLQERPTLNQIRQSPDNPLIVQQWNGREWVDTLDMRSAVEEARESNRSRH
jgi:hypothetical protein